MLPKAILNVAYRRWLALVAAGLVTLGITYASFIVPSALVTPGGAAVGVPLTSQAPGTLLASLSAAFSFSTTAGTTSGSVLSAVYRNGSGTLDFYYQIVNNAASATSLARQTSTSFAGFLTAVAFRLDGGSLTGTAFVNGTPGIIPVTADRDASGTTVGFNFVPTPPGTKIPPGTTSAVLIISTDAVTFTNGNATIIDGGVQTVASFQPTGGVPPTISKTFGAATVPLGGSTSLSFTITNPNTAVSVSGVGFTDSLPVGLLVATPNGLTGSCGGGSITATAGSGTVSLAGATLAAGASCTFSVNVVGITPGVMNNSTSAVTSNFGNGNTASAAVTVIAFAPVITKAFADSQIQLLGPGNSTALSFTITNPNAAALTGITFSDTLPGGLIVSSPNGLSGSCGGGTISAVPASNSISLTGATLAAGASCTFSVNVAGIAIGEQINTTSAITALGGTLVGLPATASTSVVDLFFQWFFSESGGGGLPRP
jgi:hypothetical protein